MPESDLPKSSADAELPPLILVVEDHEMNSRLICTILKTAGYRTRVADNGFEGLQAARECQPALILTDLQMPVLDGVEMTKLLKADPLTAAIPVLAVTAHAMADHAALAMNAGCVGFVTKPIRFQSFLSEVANVLEPADTSRT
jgi:two-component system cell cycle response regulator DivK